MPFESVAANEDLGSDETCNEDHCCGPADARVSPVQPEVENANAYTMRDSAKHSAECLHEYDPLRDTELQIGPIDQLKPNEGKDCVHILGSQCSNGRLLSDGFVNLFYEKRRNQE